MAKINLMQKLIIVLATFILFFLVNTGSVFALNPGDNCDAGKADSCANPKLVCKIKDSAKPSGVDSGVCQDGIINIVNPTKGFSTLGNAISNILTIAFAVAVLVVLVMLILGAFEWITSGGDKEAVGKARNRIINALIGLLVLAVAFALARVAAQFTGLDINNLLIPAPANQPGL